MLRFFVREFLTNPLRRAVGLDAKYGPGPRIGRPDRRGRVIGIKAVFFQSISVTI